MRSILPSVRSGRGLARASALLLLSLALGMTPVAGAAPADQVVRELGVLGIFPGSLSGADRLCAGGTFPMYFAVRNVSPGLEVPIPVVEAIVTVSDDKGLVRAMITDAAGGALIDWPINRPGRANLTVTASKTDYVSAAPERISLNVMNCQWALAVYFHEEYAILPEVSLVVGATTTWKGSLKATPGSGESATGEISLAGGSGSYQFYAADKIEAPFHFSMDPPQSGDYNLQVRGTSDGQTVRLEMQTVPVQYPQMVGLKATDYGPWNLQVNYVPPWPTSGGNGLFLELNKLNNPTFPATGGAITINSGMSCYFYTADRTKYSLTIVLYPLTDTGASLQTPADTAGLPGGSL